MVIDCECLNLCLEWNSTNSIHRIAQFFKMNFAPCSLLGLTIIRTAQRDYQIPSILSSCCEGYATSPDFRLSFKSGAIADMAALTLCADIVAKVRKCRGIIFPP